MIPLSCFWLTAYSEVTEWTANAEKLLQPAVEKSSVRNREKIAKQGLWFEHQETFPDECG